MADLIDCPTGFAPGANKFGTFANAFRVVPESGPECFLDFCVYSAQENRAEVVARIRIHRSFLTIIRDRIGLAMSELVGTPPTESKFKVKDGQLLTSSGDLVLFKIDGEN